MSMSFAALFIPHFAVQSVLRLKPEIRNQAVAVLEGKPPLEKVIDCNSKAHQQGVEYGMGRAQAELFKVHLFQRSLPQETTAGQALRDCASTFSPRFEDVGLPTPQSKPGDVPSEGVSGKTILLDLTGVGRLHQSLETLARKLQQQVIRLGMQAHVGIAGNPDAAALAARGFSGITILEPGKEAEQLSSLAVDVLELSPSIGETFQLWGIRTLGQLAGLPEVGLVERLGQEGERLQTLARGAGHRLLVPTESVLEFRESFELEFPIDLLEPLAFILSRLLHQLCARLAARSLAATQLQLTLELDSSPDSPPASAGRKTTIHRRTLRLPIPSRNVRNLLKLLQLDLESHPPKAAVTEVVLEAFPARPRFAQTGLFTPLSPEPERLAITLAKVSSIVGPHNAGRPLVLNTHRRDAFQVEKFVSEEQLPVQEQPSCPAQGPQTVLRRFRPEPRAWVQTHEEKASPIAVTFHNQRRKVAAAAGPWNSCGDWWNPRYWSREEWDVILEDPPARRVKESLHEIRSGRGAYRIYRDLLSGHWFVEGEYD
ncbi:MAG: DNA polymerase Y family protein [Acidobacteriota bacterium]